MIFHWFSILFHHLGSILSILKDSWKPFRQVPSCKILLSLTSSGSLSNEHEEAIQKLAKSGGIGPLVQAMKDLPCNLPLGLNVHLYSLIVTMNSAIRSLNLRPFQRHSWP